MRQFLFLAMVALCATGLMTVRADDHDEHEDREEMQEHEEDDEEIEILDRTVRLDFRAVPLEDDDLGVYVVTSSSGFETAIRFEGDDGVIKFGVAGEVRLLHDGRIFVRFEAHTVYAGEDGEAEFHVASGVTLKPGQELAVSRMGDKTLMVRASYVDTKSARD